MIATLGKWEIKTSQSEHLGSAAIRLCLIASARPEVPASALELEQEAGDFIARHVLEKDSVIFEG